MLLCSIAHSIICTRLFRGKMHSDWFNGIQVLQGRWQHAEKVGYCYPSGLENTLCKGDIYVPLVTKGLKAGTHIRTNTSFEMIQNRIRLIRTFFVTSPSVVEALCITNE